MASELESQLRKLFPPIKSQPKRPPVKWYVKLYNFLGDFSGIIAIVSIGVTIWLGIAANNASYASLELAKRPIPPEN